MAALLGHAHGLSAPQASRRAAATTCGSLRAPVATQAAALCPAQLISGRPHSGVAPLPISGTGYRSGSGRGGRLACRAALDSMEQQYAKTAKKALVSGTAAAAALSGALAACSA